MSYYIIIHSLINSEKMKWRLKAAIVKEYLGLLWLRIIEYEFTRIERQKCKKKEHKRRQHCSCHCERPMRKRWMSSPVDKPFLGFSGYIERKSCPVVN